MSLFKEVEGDVAIVSSAGVYKQVPIYTRNGFLFAACAGGFVRLKADGSTSKPNLILVHLETELDLHKDRIGRLGTGDIPDAKPLLHADAKRLMLEA